VADSAGRFKNLRFSKSANNLHQFASLDEAQRRIGEFIARYNTEWLIERLGHRTPTQARAEALARVA
jgi:transposase InsO family protein